MATYKKDPNATLDYTFDWTAYLLPITDTIVSATFMFTGGLTQVSTYITATKATVFVSGGTVDTPASITCRVVTAGGRTDDRTIPITVVER